MKHLEKENQGTFTTLDWKATPNEVLERVDDILQEYKLQVLMVETGEDNYVFDIQPK